jgi:hypothetical protein
MEFVLFFLALIGLNFYLSRVDTLQGNPEAERRPWLHKSGSWSVLLLLICIGVPALTFAFGIDGLDPVFFARLAGVAGLGLMMRIVFLLVLNVLVKDDTRRVRWLLNWNKAALLYVVVSVVVNVPNLLG